jgi:HrpA-like RNA helicase
MVAMGLPDPRKFPFIEPPPAESIENSILSLKEHVGIEIILPKKFNYKYYSVF